MALTQEAILTFLLEHGGKVKNSELLNYFRSQINGSDPAEKQHNRDLFKKCVNSVAVVKQVDDVKFVVVRKRYQDFVKGGPHVIGQKAEMEDSFGSQNASFSSTSPHRGESGKMLYSDFENNNMYYPSNINGNCFSDNTKHMPSDNVQTGRPLSRNLSSADTTTVKVLNISSDQASRAGKSGAVFAVIAVKSPPRPPRETEPMRQDGLNSEVPQQKTSEKLIMMAPTVPAMDSCFPTFEQDGWSSSQCWKNRHTEAPGFPHLMKTHNKTTRQGDDAKYSESVPLEPLAHEWLVKSAAGLWGQIYGLLLQDTQLAKRKDFMSGFTALHWAAKAGNSEMVHKIMDISKKRGTCVNINSKTHGGYTPLHIAAIHGHSEVMVLLVQGYGAKVNVRDNDGKKPYHYLGKGVSAEVRELLGGLQQDKYRDKTEDEEYREQPKGLNTISKLFQPHIGRKQKATAKFIHDW
ncbi:ankyrin repeat domain-containing protein SOWAHA [Centroberyx affinis]|uniref:ankyrin repeat domain-containing protein SOWAHA n=1 Tax=Centroberyx affinis TaxID=166261 RepID=UPI003A5BD67D